MLSYPKIWTVVEDRETAQLPYASLVDVHVFHRAA